MKVVNLNWGVSGNAAIRTDSIDELAGRPPCPFVGVAIGPESREGAIRVNGILLQAGRVLALRENVYTITKAHAPRGDVIGSAETLQLMLFESGDELATEVARPNHRFRQDPIAGRAVGAAAFVEVIAIPFTGRRQCLIYIDTFDRTNEETDVTETGDGGPGPGLPMVAVNYRVTGHRLSLSPPATVGFRSKRLVEVSAADLPVAFYIGGTDNGECWDELTVEIQSTSGTQTFVIEAETIGEIGAR